MPTLPLHYPVCKRIRVVRRPRRGDQLPGRGLFGTIWKVNVTVRWSHLSGSRRRADDGLSPAVMNEPAPAVRTADRLLFVFQLRLDSQISNQSVEVVGVDAENPRRVRVALPRAAKGVTDETYLRLANRIVQARQIRPR